jgi:hypothetical protein
VAEWTTVVGVYFAQSSKHYGKCDRKVSGGGVVVVVVGLARPSERQPPGSADQHRRPIRTARRTASIAVQPPSDSARRGCGLMCVCHLRHKSRRVLVLAGSAE